ncbi:hypothetical protein HanIR_Chr05g0242051 [Helianthus annuus]|nr:hypothetical protein HanIR_Chr05g0242051 [Helianthus annuus]
MIVETRSANSTCNEANEKKHNIQHRNLRHPAVGYGSHQVPKRPAVRQERHAVRFTTSHNLRQVTAPTDVFL